MTDPYETYGVSLTSPARDLVPVTPDDDADLAIVAKALLIHEAGDVEIVTDKGETRVIEDCLAGEVLTVRVRRVKAANTTSTKIYAYTD